MTIRPGDAALKTGATLQLYAVVTGFSTGSSDAVTWSVTEGSLGGSVTDGGLYTAPAAEGVFHVVATSVADSARSATCTVTVTKAVAVVIEPSAVSVAALGTRQFTATVTGTTTDQGVTWSVKEGAAGGSISSPGGLYTAPASAGTFHVVATSVADPTKSASATVTVVASQVVVTVSPSLANVVVGLTQQFSANVTGTTTNHAVTWSVVESGGGSISTTGLYTAPTTTTGTYHIMATSVAEPTSSAQATVLVTTTPAVTISIEPATASVLTGASKQFNANVTGATSPQVTWTVKEGAPGGSVTSSGYYTAPATPNTYHVVATSVQDSTKSATAEVVVSSPPVTVTVSPTSVTVAPGAQYKFNATVNNAANTTVSWSVLEPDGGALDPSGNYTAPKTVTTEHVVATSKADPTKSATATVFVCASNVLCTPSNQCHIGSTSCSATGQSCTDLGTSAPSGTNCGMDQVCNGAGSCISCVSGQMCTPADPCASGATSCVTGSSQCVPAGAKLADNTACGDTGTCQGGRCTCPAGSTFTLGTCAVCPGFSGTTVYVNSDPTKGIDNACCGRTQNQGSLGGPCLTVGQAYQNTQGTNWSITVTPDSLKNLSSQESYPLHLGRGVSLNFGAAFVKGAAGQDIIKVDVDTSSVTVQNGTLGVDASGRSGGAINAIYVGAVTGQSATAYPANLTIAGVVNGIRVDGGKLSYASITVNQVTNAAILCRSEGAALSTIGGANITVKSAFYGFFGGQGCRLTGGLGGYLGPSSGACPIPKPIQYGVWLEGDAVFMGSPSARCAQVDGLSLRANPNLAGNNPQAQITNGNFEHSGCAGIYVATGKASVKGTSIRYNHFGVWLSSSGAATDPNLAPVTLNGGTSANHLLCNSSLEPGQCGSGPYAAKGFSVFNNSGYTVDVSNVYWGDSPVSKCTCDAQLQSCACVGSPYGQTTPPDAISIVNSPYGSVPTGTPSVVMTQYLQETNPTCTF